jgi:hypothetical protein
MKYQKLYQLKQIVKALAELNKCYRLTNKEKYDPIYDVKEREASAEWLKVIKDTEISTDARLLHIAYSMLKGKTYFQAERSVRPENQLDLWEWKAIVKIMEKYKDEENTNVIPDITNSFPQTKVNWKEEKVVEVENE